LRRIQLKEVTKSFHDRHILHRVNLTIPSGEFFALLGPSGCGKTTLLRLIAGFENLDYGAIYIGNKEITKLPVNRRSVNIVFQNYALFPHFNVFENIAYSLRIQGHQNGSVEEKVQKMLRVFHLEDHAFKFRNQLSGGQQQRVALARAVINQPDVLLLDEPLAALDFKLREKMLVELIDLQDELQTTFVYVTHDQFEALTVADHMAIMNHQGEIEQIGTPKEIYEFPISSFVAKFVGTTNLLKGTLCQLESNPTIKIPNLGRFSLHIPEKKGWMKEGCTASMSVRPEKIVITKQEGSYPSSNRLKGIVSQIVYYGRSTQYSVIVNNRFKIRVFKQNEEHIFTENIDYDDEVHLCWQKENTLLLEQ